MRERVAFQREPFREPRLELRVCRVDLVGHDADRRPAVDLFEPVQDRAEERLVLGRVAHVVDRQHDDGFDPRLADPLGRDQLGEIAVRVVRIHLVEIGQPVAVGRRGGEAVEPATDRSASRQRQPSKETRRRGMARLLTRFTWRLSRWHSGHESFRLAGFRLVGKGPVAIPSDFGQARLRMGV